MGMTRPLNLSRPVACAKCGGKFTRTHGREKLCAKCKRNDVKTRLAAQSSEAAKQRQAGIEDGSDCQYPACGHKMRDRAVDVMNGTCRLRVS
jgi:hypothetical protein